MHLGYHGGKCCGIKVIWGFGSNPLAMDSSLEAIKITNADIAGDNVSTRDRFFHLAAPEETCVERLDRYIAFVKVKRPKHIIEAVLAEVTTGYLDQKVWFPILEERGFKRINKAKNSNSGNTCHVFHLNIGE